VGEVGSTNKDFRQLIIETKARLIVLLPQIHLLNLGFASGGSSDGLISFYLDDVTIGEPPPDGSPCRCFLTQECEDFYGRCPLTFRCTSEAS